MFQNLQNKFNAIEAQFVEEITASVVKYKESMMEQIRTMKLSDLASEDSPLSTARPAVVKATPERPSATLPASDGVTFRGRVTSAEKLVERIVAVLQANPGGVPTSDLRNSIHASQSDYAKAISIAMSQGLLLKHGQKRGTVYALSGNRPATSPTSEQANPQQGTAAA